MYSHESLSEIEHDLEMAFLQAMRGDYQNTSVASAKIATQTFMRRIEAFAKYFAYQEARRLTNRWSDATPPIKGKE